MQETAGSRVPWILSNAGHEPELQSYTAACGHLDTALLLLSLSPSLCAELPLWFWGRGGEVPPHTWATLLVAGRREK